VGRGRGGSGQVRVVWTIPGQPTYESWTLATSACLNFIRRYLVPLKIHRNNKIWSKCTATKYHHKLIKDRLVKNGQLPRPIKDFLYSNLCSKHCKKIIFTFLIPTLRIHTYIWFDKAIHTCNGLTVFNEFSQNYGHFYAHSLSFSLYIHWLPMKQ
jgi:hypothetical protein